MLKVFGISSYAVSIYSGDLTYVRAKEAELIFTRSLLQRAATIQPDQYQTVRGFFEKIRAAEQAPVVLVRQ
jgi:hypothetical protein